MKSQQNPAITLSPYQARIIEWVKTGRGHAVVSAVAGSGKSFTLVEIAHAIKGRGLFLAFNKSVATELGHKLEGTSMTAKTIHSLGMAAVRKAFGRVQVESRKYGKIIGEQLDAANVRDRQLSRKYWAAAKRLVDLARVDLIDLDGDTAEQLDAIIDHHALDIDPDITLGTLYRVVIASLRVGMARTSQIDFGDMIWFPNVHNLAVQTFAWVCVDECQDLSRAQLDVARRALRKGSRAIFVGDPRQAIYGFAGADAAAFGRIADEMNAAVLPLSVCYRCPSSHLALAREIVPEIEDAPGASEGTIARWSSNEVVSQIVEGDMVLCRTNAPLIDVVYTLIRAGVPAAMAGRDIGQGLVSVAKQVAEKLGALGWGVGGSDFLDGLERWHDAENRAILAKYDGDEDAAAGRLEATADKVECVRIIATRCEAKGLDAFTAAVDEIFASERPSVLCSSIHRAKGGEADRVILLNASTLGTSKWARTEWQREQERNLHYVALTRSKRDLVLVD